MNTTIEPITEVEMEILEDVIETMNLVTNDDTDAGDTPEEIVIESYKPNVVNVHVNDKKSFYAGAAAGAGAMAVAGAVAILRERKMKNATIRLVEAIADEFVDAEENWVHVDLGEVCMHVASKVESVGVRSFKNPFGMSRKDSEIVIDALMNIVYAASTLTMREAMLDVANTEDIEAVIFEQKEEV